MKTTGKKKENMKQELDDQQLPKVTITKHNKPQHQQKSNKKPNIREKTEHIKTRSIKE